MKQKVFYFGAALLLLLGGAKFSSTQAQEQDYYVVVEGYVFINGAYRLESTESLVGATSVSEARKKGELDFDFMNRNYEIKPGSIKSSARIARKDDLKRFE